MIASVVTLRGSGTESDPEPDCSRRRHQARATMRALARCIGEDAEAAAAHARLKRLIEQRLPRTEEEDRDRGSAWLRRTTCRTRAYCWVLRRLQSGGGVRDRPLARPALTSVEAGKSERPFGVFRGC